MSNETTVDTAAAVDNNSAVDAPVADSWELVGTTLLVEQDAPFIISRRFKYTSLRKIILGKAGLLLDPNDSIMIVKEELPEDWDKQFRLNPRFFLNNIRTELDEVNGVTYVRLTNLNKKHSFPIKPYTQLFTLINSVETDDKLVELLSDEFSEDESVESE